MDFISCQTIFEMAKFLQFKKIINSTNQILIYPHNHTIKDCSSRIIADKILSDMKLIFLEIKTHTYKNKKNT